MSITLNPTANMINIYSFVGSSRVVLLFWLWGLTYQQQWSKDRLPHWSFLAGHWSASPPGKASLSALDIKHRLAFRLKSLLQTPTVKTSSSLPIFIRVQLLSICWLAWRKYRPSVHMAACCSVMMAVPTHQRNQRNLYILENTQGWWILWMELF